MYNARTSFIAYRVFLGIKHVSLSYQRRIKDVLDSGEMGCCCLFVEDAFRWCFVLLHE